jgi:serine/threonine-protein kinase RsbW
VTAPAASPPFAATYRHAAGELERVRRALLAYLHPHALDERCVYAVEMVLEEWLTNVVRHGYGDGAAGAVDVAAQVAPEDVVLRFADTAPAFDPTSAAPPAFALSLEAAKPGGLGLELIRRSTRSLAYERADGQNVLTAVVPRD